MKSASRSAAWIPAVISVCFTVLVFAGLWGFGLWDPFEIDMSASTGMAQKIADCGGVSLLLGVLLFAVSREALRGDAPRREHAAWYYPVLAGLLSLGGMCVAYSFLGMWPFGEKSAMLVDMHHQYAPLLSELRHTLLTGGDTLFTWEVGLGANVIPLFGYYLASPFNLLLLIFPERLLAEGILFITLLKNALAGACFALCIQKLYGKQGLHLPLLGCMYSLMVYLIAYSWNIMWLDALFMLPLVVWAFERLMQTGRYLLYIVSLAYTLYANYYIGFMVCIFLVLYYLTYCLRSRRTGREIGIGFLRFSGCSLLAGGLTAALLLPVWFGLQVTSAAGGSLPEIGSNMDIFQLLGRHLADTTPTIRSGNLPNIYCGVLAAVCLPLYLVNAEIPLRRRLCYSGLWLALAFSFTVNWPDLLWHGLHSPNDLPYRFSFLYSFVLLLITAQVLLHLKGVTVRQVLGTAAVLVAYLVIEERFGASAYDFETVYINLLLIAVYTAILLFTARGKLRRRMATALLFMAVTVEMVIGGGNTFLTLNSQEYFTRHADYVDNGKTEATRQAIAAAQAIGDREQGTEFYRMELLPRRTCVDTALFHYRGMTAFSSSNYYTTTKFLGGIGYSINGVNSHLYESFVPFSDSLLGIRYIVSEQELTSPCLTELDTVVNGETTYHIYRNNDALSLGYVVNEGVKDYAYRQYDPVGSQDKLFTVLTGNIDSLYEYADIELAEGSDYGSTTYPAPGFRLFPDGETATVDFKGTVDTDGEVFVFVDCMAADSLTLSYGSESRTLSASEPYILNIGRQEAGTEVVLSVESDENCSGNFYLMTVNTAAYTDGMATLKKNQLQVTATSSRRLDATLNSDRSGVVMTSIPYDTGWTVTVDGTPVETYGINDALLGFDIAPGKHTIVFSYLPHGLLIGCAVSGASLVILLIVLLITGLRRHARSRAAARRDQLDFETALAIQDGFSYTALSHTDRPPLPDDPADFSAPPAVPSDTELSPMTPEAPPSDPAETVPTEPSDG